MISVATAYVEALTTDFEPGKYRNAYGGALMAIIEEKAERLTKPETVTARSTMPDLMAALKAAVEKARTKDEEPEKPKPARS